MRVLRQGGKWKRNGEGYTYFLSTVVEDIGGECIFVIFAKFDNIFLDVKSLFYSVSIFFFWGHKTTQTLFLQTSHLLLHPPFSFVFLKTVK